jgi:hypothetical protein
MHRQLTLMAALLWLISSMGCTMCASKGDMCGPVYTGECGGHCDFNERQGSILAGGFYDESGAVYEQEEGYLPPDEDIIPEPPVAPPADQQTQLIRPVGQFVR